MRALRTIVVALAAVLFAGLTTGCTASTGTTEVGVRTVLFSPIAPSGVSDVPYPPGGVYFFLRPLSTWHVFDVAVQNLAMVREASEGSRPGYDALRFKTVDGNDISVNVTISWSIDPAKAGYVVQFVGQDSQEVQEKLVRPVARAVVRDVLNRLTSEEYYEANRRFEMANQARDRLNAILEREGVLIDQVLLGEHRFNPTYEQMIRDKKVAEQEAERTVSEQVASVEEKKRDREKAIGEVNKAIAEETGKAQQRKLEGDAILYEKLKQAEAIRIEKRAQADALLARARALSGSGGKNLVKMEVAKRLKDKQIVFVPAGSGMDFRSMDMNDFLSTYGTKSLAEQ